MRLIADLPARTFSEENVVVVVWCSLREGDARVVLPVPHCLLEESFVSTCSRPCRSLQFSDIIIKTDHIKSSDILMLASDRGLV